jgi:SAM-dependent methyltransferase
MLTIDYRYFPLQSDDCVLDLGCGEGRHIIDMAITAPITGVGVDLNFRDLQTTAQRFAPFEKQAAAKTFHLQQADARCLPFASETFDKIVCSEVLEHLPDYETVLTEIYRVLKPGGLLAISVPRSWPEKICWRLSKAYHQVEGGHIRIFDARALRKQIESYRFNFISRHWAHALHTPFWWLKCLWWDKQDDSKIIRAYHRFLVWDLMDKPWLTRALEKCLNPLIGKSVVMYFRRSGDRETP